MSLAACAVAFSKEGALPVHDTSRITILSTILTWVAVCGLFAGGISFDARHRLTSLSAQGGCHVVTDHGDVQGQDLGASCAFLGIPYAGSPAGNNRWKPPPPAAPWGTLQATTPPAICNAPP